MKGKHFGLHIKKSVTQRIKPNKKRTIFFLVFDLKDNFKQLQQQNIG